MHPLHDLPLDELTPTRLWATLDRLTRALAARALFDGDLPTRDQANHAIAYGAKKRPRLGRCWSSLPSSLRLCRLRCSSSSSRSLAG